MESESHGVSVRRKASQEASMSLENVATSVVSMESEASSKSVVRMESENVSVGISADGNGGDDGVNDEEEIVVPVQDSLFSPPLSSVPGNGNEAGAFWEMFGSSGAETGVLDVIRRESFSLGDVLDEDNVLDGLASSRELLSYVFESDGFF